MRKKAGFQFKFLNYAQIFRMTVQFCLQGVLSALLVLDVTAQDTHLVLKVLLEIESELLCQSQLAVVIIEALLADSQHLGRLLQVDLLAMVIWLCAGEMQSPPAFHQIDGLSYCPLAATHILSFGAISLKVRLARLASLMFCLFLPISHQDHSWLQQISREETFMRAQLTQPYKVISNWVINSDAGHLEGTILGEDGGEVNGVCLQIDFQINDDGLHVLLLLEYEGLQDLLVRCFYSRHQVLIFSVRQPHAIMKQVTRAYISTSHFAKDILPFP